MQDRVENLYGFMVREPDKRRVERSQRANHNIKSMWQRSHEIINLSVRGYKDTEIAKILNICVQTVSNTLNSDLGQRKVSDYRKMRDRQTEMHLETIDVLTTEALNIYGQIFSDVSGECSLNDKKKVADTVLLELSGLRAPTKIHSQSITTTLTKEELDSMKERGFNEIKKAKITKVEDVEDETEEVV